VSAKKVGMTQNFWGDFGKISPTLKGGFGLHGGNRPRWRVGSAERAINSPSPGNFRVQSISGCEGILGRDLLMEAIRLTANHLGCIKPCK